MISSRSLGPNGSVITRLPVADVVSCIRLSEVDWRAARRLWRNRAAARMSGHRLKPDDSVRRALARSASVNEQVEMPEHLGQREKRLRLSGLAPTSDRQFARGLRLSV